MFLGMKVKDPQAKECGELLEAGRDKRKQIIFPSASRKELSPADNLILAQ